MKLVRLKKERDLQKEANEGKKNNIGEEKKSRNSESMSLPLPIDNMPSKNTRLGQLLSQSPQFQGSFEVGSPAISEGTIKSGGSSDKMEDLAGPWTPVDETFVPKVLTHSASIDINESFLLDDSNEAKVLVIYTGGTIGMVRNKEGALAPQSQALERNIRAISTMHDETYAMSRFYDLLANYQETNEDALLPLVLPDVPNHKRIIYTIYEYDPLLDSSNMTMDDWIQISVDIKDSYTMFDGFVVLHGTDTLSYTASALSFMLENLGKPVIITGSQIPCFETRSDGRDNIVGALILAGNYNIPEVGVYFRHQLMRGNRTIKISSGDLDAFTSPNMSPLVKAGIDIDVDYKSIHRSKVIKKFKVHADLNRNVVLLRLFPSIRSDTVAHFLEDPIQGVVLQCYGAGNVPSNRQDIMTYIREATERGVIIVSVTQCTHGGVSGLYETGKALIDVGVIPGIDITPEAALTKLSYVLSKTDLNLKQKRQLMMTNLAGEMTVSNKQKKLTIAEIADVQNSPKQLELMGAIAKSLYLKSSEELKDVEDVLFPSILCAAAFKGNLKTLKQIKQMGADLAMMDYDKRTPLHVAASEGSVELVEFLLKNGASVHVRDRNNDSPLKCAIDAGHEDVIKLLVECGAHLHMSNQELGEILCQHARKGDLQKLRCYHSSGVSLETKNISMNTPLHMAVETGQEEVVQFLISIGVSTNELNIYGQSPKTIATVLRRINLLKILRGAEGEDALAP